VILVSILGAHHSELTPVYYSLFESLEGHLILHDNAPWRVCAAQSLQRGMNAYEAANARSWRTDAVLLEGFTFAYDPAQISATLDRCAEGKEIWLHSSDTPLTLTLSWAKAIFDRGGKAIAYDIYENKASAIDGAYNSKPVALKNLDLKTFCALADYKILRSETRSDLEPRREAVVSLFGAQKERFDRMRYEWRAKENCSREALLKNYADIARRLTVCGFDMPPSNKNALNNIGGIFEEAVFWIADSLGFDDLALGVQIEFAPEVINEFDILGVKGNRIFAIECKSGKLDLVETIYKYDSLISYFGSGGKAVLVKSIKGAAPQPISQSVTKRGLLNGVLIYRLSAFNMEDFKSAIKGFFDL
jgi:hypothetical protein